MKLLRSLMCIAGVVVVSQGATEEECKELQLKVDSLEVCISKFTPDTTAMVPAVVVPSADWGTGFFGSIKTGTHYTFNVELGYMHTVKRELFSRKYLGQSRYYRLGISAGMQFFNDEQVVTDDNDLYTSSGYGPYLKLQAGSPVLLNFISFNGHIKGMRVKAGSDSNHGITDHKKVLGFGGDIEFWLTEKECITIGYTDEGDNPFDKDDYDSIYPTKFRFTFGTKMFF